jgi:hypothetical protein
MTLVGDVCVLRPVLRPGRLREKTCAFMCSSCVVVVERFRVEWRFRAEKSVLCSLRLKRAFAIEQAKFEWIRPRVRSRLRVRGVLPQKI